jgi:hypothetical protein
MRDELAIGELGGQGADRLVLVGEGQVHRSTSGCEI